ncbi:MAG: LamG-like jellyroll fold domain-containing protein [Candidatus Methylacidiphilales bacterium]
MKKKFLLSILMVAVCFTKAFSQLSATLPASNATVIAGTYVDLGTGGSVITTLNTDDANSAAIPIGFTYNFNGAAYTDFILNTNGFIKLGTANPSTAALFFSTGNGTVGGPFNSTSLLDTSLIMAFNHDLIGAVGAEYRSQTTGTVGTRVCTIQFKNVTEKTTTPAVQYANMNFQIKLFEGSDIIQIIYGGFTASGNATAFKTAAVGVKGSNNLTANIMAITKGSVTAWNAPTFLTGNYTGNAFNFGNGTRPLPVSGTIYQLVPTKPNDIAVTGLFTLGKLPIAYASPHAVKARIKNNGTATQTNFYVTLTLSGVNAFVDSVLITSIAPNIDSLITFAPYTPSIVGTNLVTVSVLSDDNSSNNVRTYGQISNDNSYTYADPNLPAAGGVGFTGATGDFVAKFPYSGVANAINQIGVNFFGGGVSLAVGIWSRNTLTGLPGTLLWQSATFTSLTGLNTIPVSPAVAISDTFFVGVIQSSTINANFAFQNENPIRAQTFFFTSPTGNTAWTDFSPGSPFRFMVEPRLQTPNDVGFTAVDYPCKVLPQGQTAFNPIGNISNFGTLTQSGFNVKCAIFNASNVQVYTSTTTSPTILGGQSSPVSFPATFNPTTAGTFTIKIWSELFGDASTVNDTSIAAFTVNNIALVGGTETRLQFNGTTGYIEVANKSSVKPVTNFTIETWVLGNNALLNPGCIYSSDSSNSDTSITIETIGRRIGVTLRTSNGLFFLTSNDTIPTNNWAHVAVKYDGAELTVYVNGDTAGTIAVTGNVLYKNSPVYIGRRSGSKSTAGVSVLNGGLDEFRIWNIARTQTQIIQNMHRKIANFSQPNLMAYYRMNEGAGSASISDASGNCNSGDLVNLDPATQWFTGSVLLDTTSATIFNITSNTLQTSTTHQIGVRVENPTGIGSFAVYSALQPIIGTSPTGFTNNSTRTWMVYKYGDLTFDSVRVEFGVPSGSILASSTNNDLALNGRLMGFGAWTNTRSSAASFQRITNNFKVNFLLLNTDSFNKQFVVSSINNPLPVKLIAFNGTPKNADALLFWSTASETNNKGFEVERSLDGKTFTTIDFVKGAINSNITQKYSYTDREVFATNKTVYYRLRQIDLDGKFEYTKTITINSEKVNNTNIVVYPNPINDLLNIEMESFTSTSAKLFITDLAGKKVRETVLIVSEGANKFTIDNLAELNSGAYIINIISEGNMLFSNKFIKTK